MLVNCYFFWLVLYQLNVQNEDWVVMFSFCTATRWLCLILLVFLRMHFFVSIHLIAEFIQLRSYLEIHISEVPLIDCTSCDWAKVIDYLEILISLSCTRASSGEGLWHLWTLRTTSKIRCSIWGTLLRLDLPFRLPVIRSHIDAQNVQVCRLLSRGGGTIARAQIDLLVTIVIVHLVCGIPSWRDAMSRQWLGLDDVLGLSVLLLFPCAARVVQHHAVLVFPHWLFVPNCHIVWAQRRVCKDVLTLIPQFQFRTIDLIDIIEVDLDGLILFIYLLVINRVVWGQA